MAYVCGSESRTTWIFGVSLIAGNVFLIATGIAGALGATTVSTILAWCMIACWVPAAVILTGLVGLLIAGVILWPFALIVRLLDRR